MPSFFKNRLLSCTFVVLVVLIALVLALPTFLSSSLGNRLLISVINQSIPGKINFEKANFSWFGNQNVAGAALYDTNGDKIVYINDIAILDPLYNLIFGKTLSHPFSIKQLDATIQSNLRNETNIERALGKIPADTQIDTPERKILVHQFNANFMLFNVTSPLSISLEGKTDHNGLKGNVEMQLVFEGLHPKHWSSLTDEIYHYIKEHGLASLSCRAEINHFPVALLDDFAKLSNSKQNRLFSSILGPELNLHLKPDPTASNNYSLSIRSLHLESDTLFLLNQKLQRLNAQTKAKFDQKRFEIDIDTSLENDRLAGKVQMKQLPLDLFALLAPSANLTQYLGDRLDLDATYASSQQGRYVLNFSARTPELQFQNARLSFNNNLSVDLQGELFPRYQAKLLSPIQVHIASTMNASPIIKAELRNTIFKVSLSGKIEEGKVLQFEEPVVAEVTITPEMWQEYIKPRYEYLDTIQENIFCTLMLDPVRLSLNKPFQEIGLSGILSIDHIKFASKPYLDNIRISWNTNPSEQDLHLNLTSGIRQHSIDSDSKISAEAEISHFDITKNPLDQPLKIETKTQLSYFPTSLASLLLNQPDLSPIIGETLDINLKFAFDQTRKKAGYFDFFIDAKELHGRARLRIDRMISLYESNKPTVDFKLNLTPKSYAHLLKIYPDLHLPNKTLAMPMSLAIRLKQLNIPFEGNLPDYQNGQFDLETELSDLKWKESGNQSPLNVLAELSSVKMLNESLLDINATLGSHPVLFTKGVIKNYYNKSTGILPLDQLDIVMNGDCQKFPIDGTLGIIPDEVENNLNAIFGDSLDASFSLTLNRLNGPVKIDAHGPTGLFQLDGRLDNGYLQLNAPLNLKFQITQSLKKQYLEKSSILKNIISAKNPVALTIEPQGFRLPLFPFNEQQISVGNGKLDVGQIECKNEGTLSAITNLISPFSQEWLSIWFTPFYFSIQNGILDMKRCDILISNRYVLAFWGKHNLMKKEGDLILGIPSQTLKFAFNLTNLSEDYVLQIPFKIRKGHLDLDKAVFTARISALMARSHSDSQINWIGTALDIAMTKNLDATAPSPTTSPFPWSQADITTPEPVPETQSPKKKDKKKALINEIEKEAGSFLRQILNPH